LNLLLAAAILAAAFAFPAPAGAAPSPQALFARERAASGGDAWNRIAAVRTAGTYVQGGAVNRFGQIVDRKTGWNKGFAQVGSLHDVNGFDGAAWDFEGGPITEQTLPGIQADNVTQAYIARDGWWRASDPARMSSLGATATEDGVRVVPAGGSPVDVWIDRATGLIDREIAHTDTGLVTTVLGDYRTVGDVVISYHQVTTDPAGAVTVTDARDVALRSSIAPAELARPLPRSFGRITSGSSATAPIRLSDDPGAIVAPLRVNGKPTPIVFDSGAGSYLTSDVVKRLGIPTAGGLAMGGVGNGSENTSVTAGVTLAIGAAELTAQHAVVGPPQYVLAHQMHGVVIGGLVGAQFLQSFRTTFDFDAMRATFASYGVPAGALPARGVVEPAFSDGQDAYVRASIDGVPGVFLVDTGNAAGGIILTRRFAQQHGLFRVPGLRYVLPGGIGGHLAVEDYRGKTFTLGGATLHGMPVRITNQTGGSFASRSVAGNIGLPVLARYRITFDYRRQTVTFVPRASLDAPFRVDRSGIQLNQTGPDAFVVLSTVAGGPAEQAGIHAGDRIVAFDGRNIAAGHLIRNDMHLLLTGTKPFTVTIQAPGGTPSTVMIHPRDILPPAR
jgi:hypothetical protein